ncbi:permease [Marinobacter sp. F4216]|uniref:permease n=1 Tax=Marinobacter sp. F4216 TaxID=2874281 RepID=UPI001CBA6DAE|nr:permease [Marinobacter sp. F4216]MBZ2169988.1 permease [Marinobacter sp. F4216]
MQNFLQLWSEAATTSLGFFWMALWAFILGYLISSLIQVLITRKRMQQAMGKDGPRSMLLGTFFGFISSSCSFSALSTTRAIFDKGAGLAPSMAFMLASTNLVIELGMVIAIFLGWQFVVGEYVGGIILILVTWFLIRITRPRRLEAQARRKQDSEQENGDNQDLTWKEKLKSKQSWQNIGQTYVMEWQMVWKDVLIGFTVSGIISAMVPESFFQALFLGSGNEDAANPGFLSVLAQTLIGPVAAFFTFIGSMGNIPLAAVLFGQGVTFAGVMAFIFSDLVVLPVLRINANYYGWKMALYILALMLAAIVFAALTMHYALAFLGLLPDFSSVTAPGEREFFQLNYQFVLNLIFLAINVGLIWLWHRAKHARNKHDHGHEHHHHDHGSPSLTDKVLSVLVVMAIIWLTAGVTLTAL